MRDTQRERGSVGVELDPDDDDAIEAALGTPEVTSPSIVFVHECTS